MQSGWGGEVGKGKGRARKSVLEWSGEEGEGVGVSLTLGRCGALTAWTAAAAALLLLSPVLLLQ